MGKPTGFLEYSRRSNPSNDPHKRIKNFNEFHPPLNPDERRTQGARCMNCGIPFCQSAVNSTGALSCCPLRNLIPEWNDELFNGNWQYALARLVKTNPFPEFTGRVCPALCEASCTCGLYGSPVTIRENELAIAENGFSEGFLIPHKPEVRTGKSVAVVGSGPSGLAAAERLNFRGHSVTVYERDDRPGGLLMYGIPNMKLDKSAVERRINLMKAEGIEFVTGADVGNTVSADELLDKYDAILLCCGAKKPRDLNIPGRGAKGVYFAVDFLSSTTKSLLDSKLADGGYISAKDKKVIVVGGGDTGNDCVGTCIRHGCSSIIQIEMMPEPPAERADNNQWPEWPRILKTDYGQEEAIAVFGKDPRIYCTTVKELMTDDNGNLRAALTVDLNQVRDPATGRITMKEIPGSEKEIEADMLLIAAGFTGCEPYTAEAFKTELDKRGNLSASGDTYHIGDGKLFAAGDMRRGQSLVVWAITEGASAAREIDCYLMGYTNMD